MHGNVYEWCREIGTHVRVVTLPFSIELSGFDEGTLVALCQRERVVSFREHRVNFQGQPYLACVVVCAARARAPAPTSAALADRTRRSSRNVPPIR